MALVRSVRGNRPQFGENCWLAENATVVGDVIMGQHCTVWFNAVVREMSIASGLEIIPMFRTAQ